MKLHTLTLPTGEFMLICSSVEEVDGAQLADGFENVIKSVGATGFFCTSERVEIEDAVIQEEAVRHYWPGETEPDVALSPEWTDLNWTSEDSSKTAQENAEFTNRLLSELGYSPAGLVKDGPKTTAQLEPELAEALAPPSPIRGSILSGTSGWFDEDVDRPPVFVRGED